MSDKKVRVRFAPSPTGPLHIGGVRTALFNYLFAKKNEGDFILRIEDTDKTRYVEGAEDYILKSLEWCGLKVDEGPNIGGQYIPYRQSERKDIYKAYADKLLSNGNAYIAFDTPEELDVLRKKYETEKKQFSYNQHNRKKLNNSLVLSEDKVLKRIHEGLPYVIRFKMPENIEVVINDIVRGEVKFNTSTLDDKVLYKSDGLPTYHLANVIDDYEMKITHVIRGEEWLPSLPLHIMLYKSLGIEDKMPDFAHLPLILKPSGKGKLSKRDGDKEGFPVFPLNWKSPTGEFYAGFKEAGYFPEAFINLLAFLGWNPGTEKEIYTLKELINDFSFDKVQKGGARFDPEKAKWFNQQHLKNRPNIELAELFMSILQEKGINTDKNYAARVCSLIKERAEFILDFWEQGNYFFIAPETYDEKNVKKFWKEDTTKIIEEIKEIIRDVQDFKSSNIEDKVKEYINSKEIGFGKVMNPLRLCLVGAAKGPHLFDIMEMIGKEETVKRIRKGIEVLN